MANTIEYAKIFNAELDSAATQGLMTGWMEANAGRVKYNGGNEVKIPKMTLDGLGDYKRDTGYPAGTINLAYETMKMTQDRGKKFTIDAMDVDESNFAVTAASVLGEFQSTKVLPEIDAYRIATLFGAAKASSNVTASYTPSKEDAAIKLKADITKARKLGAKTRWSTSLSTLWLLLRLSWPVCCAAIRGTTTASALTPACLCSTAAR